MARRDGTATLRGGANGRRENLVAAGAVNSQMPSHSKKTTNTLTERPHYYCIAAAAQLFYSIIRSHCSYAPAKRRPRGVQPRRIDRVSSIHSSGRGKTWGGGVRSCSRGKTQHFFFRIMCVPRFVMVSLVADICGRAIKVAHASPKTPTTSSAEPLPASSPSPSPPPSFRRNFQHAHIRYERTCVRK